jgi:tetratricopeptide (TPR) repeat protein
MSIRDSARKLLYSGSTREAIRTLRTLKEQLQNNEIYSFGTDLREVNELLGASYLRLGHEQHCLSDLRTASCLFPVREDGYYEEEESSEAAIELYKAILRKSPDNLKAQWLLNLAHMTLGGYPALVPGSIQIPSSAIESEHPTPAFRDIAPDVGVAHSGRSGGSVVEDFDEDGDLDIMASSWGVTDQLRYYENTGGGHYTERTIEAGLKGIVGG